SDMERIHVLLEMRRLFADPVIEWRGLFNISDTNHADHGHVDDRPDWGNRVFDRQGVLNRDGIDLFVSIKAFPNHVPPTNRGYTLTHIQKFQDLANRLEVYTGTILDGYLGAKTKAAALAVQKRAGIEQDGIPGPKTVAAAERLLKSSGFSKEYIENIQQMLSVLGYYTDKIDGIPGANTTQATFDFQSDFGLEKDGIPGAKT